MHSRRRMSVGDAANLVEVDRILRVGDRVEEVDLPVEAAVDRQIQLRNGVTPIPPAIDI